MSENVSNIITNPFEFCYSFWDDKHNLFTRIPPSQAYNCCRQECIKSHGQEKTGAKKLEECKQACNKLKENDLLSDSYINCVKATGCDKYISKNFRKVDIEDFNKFASCLDKQRDKVIKCCRDGCDPDDERCIAFCDETLADDVYPYITRGDLPIKPVIKQPVHKIAMYLGIVFFIVVFVSLYWYITKLIK